jgi:hypothetical protein
LGAREAIHGTEEKFSAMNRGATAARRLRAGSGLLIRWERGADHREIGALAARRRQNAR